MAPIYKVPLSNNSQYTLDTQYTAGGTTLVLNTNVASVVQAPGTCVVDRVDSSGNKTVSKRTYYTFTGVSTTTLTGLAVADGTDQAHAVGAIVEFVPDITWAQAMYNGLTAVVDPTTQALDTTKVVDLTTAQTISNKTIKSSLSEVVTTAGGTTTYTLTPSVAIAAYATGQEFVIKMNATNTGASTINISGLGAKSLTKGGATALSSGDILVDAVYKIVYDGTQFQVGGISASTTTAATIAEVATGTDNTKMVTPLAATGFDTRTATLTNKTYSSPIFSGTSTKLSQTVRMLAYSTQIGLSAAYNQANNTNEQEVTNLRISLPIIAATCTVALRFVGYVSVGAANNTLRLRCGTSTSYLSNTEVAQAYIGGAKSIEALPIIANFSADLSTQTYVVFSCHADANPTSISLSASGNRTSIIVEVFV